MRGAVALQREWLAKDAGKDVAVYVVWSPQLGAEEKHVASAMGLIPDSRAKHYWDHQMFAGTAFQPFVGISAPAWDVWLLFDKQAVWRADGVPRAAWWEHQLKSAPPELMLNASRWASHAIALHDVDASHR
jgi:hypothetical protein